MLTQLRIYSRNTSKFQSEPTGTVLNFTDYFLDNIGCDVMRFVRLSAISIADALTLFQARA